MGPAWGKPVKACQWDLPNTYSHLTLRQSSLLGKKFCFNIASRHFLGACFVDFPTFPQGHELLTLITRRKPNQMRVLTSLEASWRAEKSPRGPWGMFQRRVGCRLLATSHTSQGSHPRVHTLEDGTCASGIFIFLWSYATASSQMSY